MTCMSKKKAPVVILLFLFFAAANLFSQSLYWGDPSVLVESGARFPAVASGGNLIAAVWQDFVPAEEGGGEIYLSLLTSKYSKEWEKNNRFAGPYTYFKQETPIFSLTVDQRGRILVAVTLSENSTEILASTDGGRSFTTLAIVRSNATAVGPNLYVSASGNLLLFVTQETEDFLALYYSVSTDGSDWSGFRALVDSQDLFMNFLPQHAVHLGRDYLIFQALASDQELNYQLYLKESRDGGRSWGEKIPLAFDETLDGRLETAAQFSNQRPFLFSLKGRIALAWERQYSSQPPQIYYGEIDREGKFIEPPERITDGFSTCHFPRIINFRDQVYLTWFDNRRGEDHIFIAGKKGFRWVHKDLSNIAGSSSFAHSVQLGDSLYLFWENRFRENSSLVYLEPDQHVESPMVRALNFYPDKPSRQDSVSIRWNIPHDSSGLAGFSYAWSLNPDAAVSRELKFLSETQSVTLNADRDGTWYFLLSANDYAGNWSEPAGITFTRDTVPPAEVELVPPEVDGEGFLLSNSFPLSWIPTVNEELSGYTYKLKFLDSETGKIPVQAAWLESLPPVVQGIDTAVSYQNRDNGLWSFTVSAIDLAGNVGKSSTLFFKLNKYIPVTYITYVDSKKDILGNVNLLIHGRGFAEGGLIREMILDRDGKKPYDYHFSLQDNIYRVRTDRLIDRIKLPEIEEGSYRLGIVHPLRGLYFSASRLSFQSLGAVKFGDFTLKYTSSWQRARSPFYFFTVSEFGIWLIVIFLALLFLLALHKLGVLVREGQMLKAEIISIARGQPGLLRKEKRMKELKQRGFGLRLKFIMLITILVILVVAMVSFPLSYFMIDTQTKNLADGLSQRVKVMLGSISSGAETNLPLQNSIEMGLLPEQIAAMDEAQYATITAQGEVDKEKYNYIWGSNDPDIASKILEGEFRLRTSRIKDEISPLVERLAEEINQRAFERVKDLLPQLEEYTTEARRYTLRTDAEAASKLEELQAAISKLNARILTELKAIGSKIGSFPEFDPEALLPIYTFYKPIVYRSRDDDIFYRGMIRLNVSTQNIIQQIDQSRRELIVRTGMIALVAVILGIIGAVIMASITITPIKKLAAGVAVIRDTEDYEELKDHHINVRSRDEIGVLADTVNDMTQKLVKAAAANKDLIIGKDVQKMFIPLEKDGAGNKGSIGSEENDNVEIYGYYEGAKGVSGDYFDFKKLDNEHYAVIMCDVAGKGIPAALIMVEVATIFSSYFRNWTIKDPGLKIDKLVYQINDMLEERGFKGRFAALIVALINVKSGAGYYCNAGDNVVHTYNNLQGKMIETKLPEAPAAGVFPSMMVEMQAGFKQVSMKLNKGDTLLLFTDGIEEAKRHFRNEQFQVVKCDEAGLEENAEHGGTHLKGSDNEELGIPRIHDLLDAIFNRQKYQLKKYHNPVPGEKLSFDFTSCSGSVEETVLGLIAVEKVFRIYPDSSAGSGHRVNIDKRIDEFLKVHFDQYSSYFGHPLETSEGSQVNSYANIMEDEQYDDLTILALRKR